MLLTWWLSLAIIHTVVSTPLVKAPSGTFQGTTLISKSGRAYSAFLGIPYAKPPVEDLRFRPPVPATALDGVYDATEFKPICIQVNIVPVGHDFGPGEEDCLYLNIYAPESAVSNKEEQKKVFVFIYGGGNCNGFTNIYIPGQLVTEQDIIVVTISYRLGYLGFLSTLTPSCEGNFGLKDQLLAISWVKENILAFGGDPNDITVGGESAGAIDISFLSLVPDSKNLFTKAFPMSGLSSVKHPAVVRNPLPTFVQTAQKAGCLGEGQDELDSDDDLDEIVDCLRKVPASTFGMDFGFKIPDLGPVEYGSLFPKPIEELFNDESYLDSIKFFDRDYLISFVYNEGDFFNIIKQEAEALLSEEQRKAFPPNAWTLGIMTQFVNSAFGPVSDKVIEKVMEYYNKNYEINPLADFAADALFHIPTIDWANTATRGFSIEKSKVHMLRFVHWPMFMAGPYKGMVHGTDLLYLFDTEPEFINKIINLHVNGSLWGEEDDYLKQKYISIAADFIKTGNPGISLGSALPVGWPAYDEHEGHYLQFGLRLEVKTQFKPERVRLWSTQIPEWIDTFPLEQPDHSEL
ncbi:unnamed protein product [Lymnaea stagnalis]|uniref:Carboxylic ester hydrolase n=1 Tax=Lymnaea stagnalis TaxID=6523 RepID=A0AAV2H4P2_LYMST